MSKKIENIDERLFTEQETAKYLSVSRSYLRQDRMNGTFKNRTPAPNYYRFGKMIRYKKQDLDSWIEKHFVSRD